MCKGKGCGEKKNMGKGSSMKTDKKVMTKPMHMKRGGMDTISTRQR